MCNNSGSFYKKNIFERLLHVSHFSCGSAGKECACNVGDLGLIPSLGRSPGEGKGDPFQYSGLENSMDCIVHGGHKELDTTEQLSLSCMYNKEGNMKEISYLWDPRKW